MLDRAGAGGGSSGGSDFGSDEGGGDFGSAGPSAREKKPAMAGAGKRADMDDEIPF
jgi:single-strand DNA-binding protein